MKNINIKFLSFIMLVLIKFYKSLISPFFLTSCRFLPSCSCYMHEAILIHGPFLGLWIGIKRLMRCHPMGKSGFDPVPIYKYKNTTR